MSSPRVGMALAHTRSEMVKTIGLVTLLAVDSRPLLLSELGWKLDETANFRVCSKANRVKVCEAVGIGARARSRSR
jgi:hypothetical protein